LVKFLELNTSLRQLLIVPPFRTTHFFLAPGSLHSPGVAAPLGHGYSSYFTKVRLLDAVGLVVQKVLAGASLFCSDSVLYSRDTEDLSPPPLWCTARPGSSGLAD